MKIKAAPALYYDSYGHNEKNELYLTTRCYFTLQEAYDDVTHHKGGDFVQWMTDTSYEVEIKKDR